MKQHQGLVAGKEFCRLKCIGGMKNLFCNPDLVIRVLDFWHGSKWCGVMKYYHDDQHPELSYPNWLGVVGSGNL